MEGKIMNQSFRPEVMQKCMKRLFVWFFLPLIFFLLLYGLSGGKTIRYDLANIPLFVFTPDSPTAWGLIAIGGTGIGIVAMGGLSVGLIAYGGLSVGLFSVGGGAIGLVAFGGGAIGWIAVGGGAVGKYVLAGGGTGVHVLSYTRHDRTAAEFFCRWISGLREAFPNGTQILVDKK